jgi:HPt (histidine-containing phosphotransfer) domain-containing protein
VKTASAPSRNPTPDPALPALLPAYFERRAADARLLDAALATRDYPAIAAIGHRLKGLGSTYGHDAISTTGRELEAAAGAGDATRISRLIADYRRVLAELN